MANEPTNPFKKLPTAVPGAPIKAVDFNTFSEALRALSDLYGLAASLFGKSFAEARSTLTAGNYTIEQVMSIFGTQLANVEDPALDDRKVIQVVPVELGERRVAVVLTEMVQTQRTVPNLMGLTYEEARERLEGALGDVTFSQTSRPAPDLTGRTLEEARVILSS